MSIIKILAIYLVATLLLFGCSEQQRAEQIETNETKGKTIHHIDFESAEDIDFFKAETEIDEKEVTIEEGALDIDAIKGATVWLKQKLTAPIKIEYTAMVVEKGGPNDRVSDLNCFFMAIDPRCPANIFSCADSIRTGNFGTYHDLRTYYVGYGGNGNATTRMRRYPGYTRERPMLPEHDLGEPHTIKANTPIKISIKVVGNKITYSHNGNVIFTMRDELPYHEGWFAFRTVRNHMQILDFKVIQIEDEQE